MHTYSIVARDPRTGQIGAAIQSHWFAAGSLALWLEAGVGAVATQAFAEPAYGPRGLALIRAGHSAPDALESLLAADEQRAVRQVAMIDVHGRVDAFTGERTIRYAGQSVGEGYSVQANLMRGDVWTPMASAFESSTGDLAERMLAALDAAEGAGGDLRGRQSAALVVVRGEATARAWEDRVFDLRVDDHPEPLRELRRLTRLARAYQRLDAADRAAAAGDLASADRAYAVALDLVPDAETNGEMTFWNAVLLARSDRLEDSLPLFRRAFAQDPGWREVVRRLPAAGQLPDDPAVLSRILS